LTEAFLELVPRDEAVRRLLDALSGLELKVEEIESIDSPGRVLSRGVESPEDLPGFDRSSMDGFAVRASDTFGASEGLPAYLEIVGEVLMGEAGVVAIGPGQSVRISTGGAVPPGADAVVMVENTEVSGPTLEVVKGAAPGENVIRRDEEISRGAVLFKKGQVIGPAQVGALSALGITRVPVFALPLVGIISTGDELVMPGETPGPGQVRDVNSDALRSAVVRAGCVPRNYGIVGDVHRDLLEASRLALSECDALLISGGSSAGVRDITVDVLGELGLPGVLVHGIYLKPGKPTLVAVCGGKPVVGLPGNPASALAVFREVIAPALARLRGESEREGAGAARRVEAVIDRSVASATGRLELVPVTLRRGGEVIVASPISGKSSLIGTLARARGQVRIPEGSEGLESGQTVSVELLE